LLPLPLRSFRIFLHVLCSIENAWNGRQRLLNPASLLLLLLLLLLVQGLLPTI
jgi:hypothetical protein